ncbi:MAG: ABC transporter substrate-binding protein [Alphaproteobacteria bacterium]|nr:ABC transporter substrate-binding protein [Alphaproteobacteria bacterium]
MGYGSACDLDSGLCRTVDMHPRCDATYPEDLTFPVKRDENYLIASLFGRSDAHIARYRGAELAVKHANQNQGVDGHDFGIIHCNYDVDASIDDLDSTGAVEEISTWLSDDVGIPAIIGPAASSLTGAVYNKVAEEYDTLVVSPSATATTLIDIDGTVSTDAEPGLFWRTAPPDGGQAIAIVADMRNEYDPLGETVFRTGPTSALAILYQEGAYGEGLAFAVGDLLNAAGGDASLFIFSTDTLGAQVAAVANSGDGPFDEVLVISSDASDYNGFLAAANANAAFATLPIFMSDGGRTSDIFPAVGALGPNIRGSVPALPEGIVFDGFDASYAVEYGESSNLHSFVPHTYDAASLVIYAHAWAVYNEEGTRGVHLARGFRKLSTGPDIAISAPAITEVIAQFRQGNSIDIEGTSGLLDYNLTTGELPSTIEVWSIAGTGTGQTFEQEYIFVE